MTLEDELVEPFGTSRSTSSAHLARGTPNPEGATETHPRFRKHEDGSGRHAQRGGEPDELVTECATP